MNRIKDLTEAEFVKELLVLFNRNSLGHILPSLRGVTVGWDGHHENVKLIAYFDREPTEVDIESFNEIVTEMEGVIGFSVSQRRFLIDIEVECRYSDALFHQLESLNSWAYFRYEGHDIAYSIPLFVRQALNGPPVDSSAVTLAVQQALIGRVAPYTRKITVGWNISEKSICVRAYTDTPENEKQRELLVEALDCVLSLLPFSDSQAECVFSQVSYADLDDLDICTYLRYEPEMGYFED